MGVTNATWAKLAARGVRASFAALISILAISAALSSESAIANPIGVAANSGERPTVLYLSDQIRRPKSLRITVSASPEAPLSTRHWVSCHRGLNRIRRARLEITGSGTFRARPVLRRADACRVISIVTYATAEQSGTLSVRVQGVRRKSRPRATSQARPGASPPSCAPASFLNQLQNLPEGITLLDNDSSYQSTINGTLLPLSTSLRANGFKGETLFGVDAPFAISQFENLKSQFVEAAQTVHSGGDMDDTQDHILLANRSLILLAQDFKLSANPSSSSKNVPDDQVTSKFATLFEQMAQDFQDELFLFERLQQVYGGTYPSSGYDLPNVEAYPGHLLLFPNQGVEPVLVNGFAGQTLFGVDADEVLGDFNQVNVNLRKAAAASSLDAAAPFIGEAEITALELLHAFDAC